MKIWTFDVDVDEKWVEDDPSLTGSSTNGRMVYTASVRLGGVLLHTQDVTRIMRSGAPGRYEEAGDEVMREFALKLKDAMAKMEVVDA